MKSARRIFGTGFACPYIADEILPQVFGQVSPAPTVVCEPTMLVAKAKNFLVGKQKEATVSG